MSIRRLVLIAALAAALLPAYATAALAGPEWCDDGSPPPNDWRFRPTGGPSAGSSTSWLRSTTSGTLDLATGVNTLEGGVALGMDTALRHAGTKEPGERPERAGGGERPTTREHRPDR